MANHVIRDRLWASQKLSRCSLKAALAYPWLFLVADDWGRFEYRPRVIWGQVFSSREDVSMQDVKNWLVEYELLGLLKRYHMDGDLAYWTGFQGRPPSKRRPSLYPDPEQFPEFRCSSPTPVPAGYPSGTEPVPDPCRPDTGRVPPSEQSRAETEQSGDSAGAALVLHEPSWSTEACAEWKHFLGTPPGGRIGAALKPLVTEHGWDVVRPLWRTYLEEAVLSPEDPKWTNPQTFAQTFKARMVRAKAGPRAAMVRVGIDPKADRRKAAMVAGVTGGLKGDGTFEGGSTT